MSIDGGLRVLFHKHLKTYGAHVQAIETGGTGRGIPDTNMCLNGREVWVEFKRTASNSVRLDPEQSAWILQRIRAGGNVFIAIRKRRNSSKRLNALDELWIVNGDQANELREQGLRAIDPVSIYSGGPSSWDWQNLKNLLFEEKDEKSKTD